MFLFCRVGHRGRFSATVSREANVWVPNRSVVPKSSSLKNRSVGTSVGPTPDKQEQKVGRSTAPNAGVPKRSLAAGGRAGETAVPDGDAPRRCRYLASDGGPFETPFANMRRWLDVGTSCKLEPVAHRNERLRTCATSPHPGGVCGGGSASASALTISRFLWRRPLPSGPPPGGEPLAGRRRSAR